MRHLLVFLAAVSAMSVPLDAAKPSRPNILLILADDLGWGNVGCYNPQSQIPIWIDWQLKASV